MRIEPDQVGALVMKLREWGIDISSRVHQDLRDEFDVRIQEDLNGGGQYRREDPDTSKWAARMTQEDSRGRVFFCFLQAGEIGLTNDELYMAVDPNRAKDRDSWVPRVGELKRMKLVTGTSDTRLGNRNVKQQVNVITALGFAFALQKGW